MNTLLPVERFMATLKIVRREGDHLSYSWRSLFDESGLITHAWVEMLDERPEEAVQLEAFVSRFGRMQDTLGLSWLGATGRRSDASRGCLIRSYLARFVTTRYGMCTKLDR